MVVIEELGISKEVFWVIILIWLYLLGLVDLWVMIMCMFVEYVLF